MASQDDFYRTILDNLHDGVYFVDRERRITYWNKAAERISGYSAKTVIGSSCADNILVHVNEQGVQLCREGCPLGDTICDGVSREDTVFLRHANGYRVPVRIRVSPILDERGEIVGAVETFSDDTKSISALQRIGELQRAATLDALTGLGSRYATEIQLQNSLNEFARIQLPFGILFTDIDFFKRVNDRFGHDVGDKVLVMTAETISRNVRSYDFVGRWGGDEFIVIVVNATGGELSATADKLRNLVEQSRLQVEQAHLHVTISIGGTLVRPADTIETLLRRADKLLYESKAAGRNRISISDILMQPEPVPVL